MSTCARALLRSASVTCSRLLTTMSGLIGLFMTSSLTEMPSRYCFRIDRRSAFSFSSRLFSLSIAVLSSSALLKRLKNLSRAMGRGSGCA